MIVCHHVVCLVLSLVLLFSWHTINTFTGSVLCHSSISFQPFDTAPPSAPLLPDTHDLACVHIPHFVQKVTPTHSCVSLAGKG